MSIIAFSDSTLSLFRSLVHCEFISKKTLNVCVISRNAKIKFRNSQWLDKDLILEQDLKNIVHCSCRLQSSMLLIPLPSNFRNDIRLQNCSYSFTSSMITPLYKNLMHGFKSSNLYLLYNLRSMQSKYLNSYSSRVHLVKYSRDALQTFLLHEPFKKRGTF